MECNSAPVALRSLSYGLVLAEFADSSVRLLDTASNAPDKSAATTVPQLSTHALTQAVVRCGAYVRLGVGGGVWPMCAMDVCVGAVGGGHLVCCVWVEPCPSSHLPYCSFLPLVCLRMQRPHGPPVHTLVGWPRARMGPAPAPPADASHCVDAPCARVAVLHHGDGRRGCRCRHCGQPWHGTRRDDGPGAHPTLGVQATWKGARRAPCAGDAGVHHVLVMQACTMCW
eukprot:355034-Chlamydomonas_euryale.AAC.5